MIVYGGGFSFYKYEGSCLTNLFDNVRINVSEITQEQKQINKKILAEKSDTSSNLTRASAYNYTGLSSTLFTKYAGSGWINNTNDCGSYCAAVLLAYYDDNISNSYIPDRVRKQKDYSYSAAQSLVSSLIACIDPDHSGTVASEVGGGINNWLYVYSSVSNRTSYSTYGGTWDKATSVISNSKRPIIIGTLKILGAQSDHWVVAYQHRLDSSDNGYYKCVNVWGSYTAEIKAKHTRGWVAMNG